MKIKNKRSFNIAIMTLILSCISMGFYLSGSGGRFLVSTLLLVIIAIINFVNAFSKKGFLEELNSKVDERDVYVVMKTCQLTMKIINNILCTLVFVFLLAYAALKLQFLIVIAITLCGILILMFIVSLCVNIYFEKHS